MRRLTPFGKAVRKYRIDCEIRAKEMAEALGVSVSYLSAVETGAKKLSDAFVGKVVKYFDRQGVDATDLYVLADQEKTRITLDISDVADLAKIEAAAFARKFSELTPKEREKKISDLLKMFDSSRGADVRNG